MNYDARGYEVPTTVLKNKVKWKAVNHTTWTLETVPGVDIHDTYYITGDEELSI